MQDLSLEKQSEQTPQSMLRRAKRPPRVWQWIALALVAGLSAFLNFYALAQNGYGNQFYSSAVKSMQMNWHTFFFVSFDPAGFIAVDKPPVDLWLQTLSVKLFGFSGPSLLFPQALAGVLAVLVLFHLVRRSFGFGAGLLSALMMATTPIAVVISRNNNLDMMLVLVMLLATWAVMIAAETGHLRWLILGAILVGLGFNVKMLEAYLVVPALGLLYLLTAPRTWSIRLLHLLPAILLLLVVSLAWIEAVDLTPAANRPFVGSTRTNSEFDLAVGYNGIGRLVHLPNPAPTPDPSRATPAGSHSPLVVVASLASSRKPPTARITGISTKHSPAGGSRETGTPGPLRLLQLPLGGQIGWLIPLAFFGMLALLVQNCWRWLRDGERRGLILWGMWFLTTLIFFNIAVSIHGYYTVMMAAPISALAGIGLVTLWQAYRTRPFRDWRGWLLPLALLTEALFQTTLLVSYPGWSVWMTPLILVLVTLAALLLILGRLLALSSRLSQRTVSSLAQTGVLLGLLAMLLAPTIWSLVSLTYMTDGPSPVAGPHQPTLAASLTQMAETKPIGAVPLTSTQQKLLHFLLAHRGHSVFLAGTLYSTAADTLILASGLPVMTLGGFAGNDPILTLSKLETFIKSGKVRFFLLPFSLRTVKTATSEKVEFQPPSSTNRANMNWMAMHCPVVPYQAWEAGRTVMTHVRMMYVVKIRGKRYWRHRIMTQQEFHPSVNGFYSISNGQSGTLYRLFDCASVAARA